MNNPIPSTEIVDRQWLKEEIEEWKGIQEMMNKSQQHEEDKVLHHTWSNDTPYLQLYHTLVDDSLEEPLGKPSLSKQEKNWMDGIPLYIKISMRRQWIDSTRKNGHRIV